MKRSRNSEGARWPLKMKGRMYVMTESEEWLFRRTYPCTPNWRMAELFGVGKNMILKLGKDMGLKKDKEKLDKGKALAIRAAFIRSGYLARLRGKEPEQCREPRNRASRERHHMTLLRQTNLEAYKAMCRRLSEAHKESILRDRRRMRMGLEPEKHKWLPQYSYTQAQKDRRAIAKRKGYILGDVRENMGERYVIYYDDDTKRSAAFERGLEKIGLAVMRLED